MNENDEERIGVTSCNFLSSSASHVSFIGLLIAKSCTIAPVLFQASSPMIEYYILPINALMPETLKGR